MTQPTTEPIRAELLSVERLEDLAETIAKHRVSERRRPDAGLLARVRDNGRVLLRCYRTLASVVNEDRTPTPAAEWLVDNFHIVEEVLNEIRTDLPPGFYRRLPTLVNGPHQDAPRVLEIAWTFVAHTDSRFEATTLQRFVLAFQRSEPLSIGELWALPIALRLTLLENLRRLTEEIIAVRADRLAADRLANIVLGQTDIPADPLAFSRVRQPAAEHGLRRATGHRLRDHDPVSTPASGWLEERIAALGTTSQELVRAEHQRQAAANVSGAQRHHELQGDGDVRLARLRREGEPDRPGLPRRERIRARWIS
jgi:cyclic beta-1,2-glucan synthetase